MDWNREQIKQRLAVVCGGVLFYCVLQKLTAVLGVLMRLLGIFRAVSGGRGHCLCAECAHDGH